MGLAKQGSGYWRGGLGKNRSTKEVSLSNIHTLQVFGLCGQSQSQFHKNQEEYFNKPVQTLKCVPSHQVLSDSAIPSLTVAHQTLLSMGFPRQKHWIGLPFPPPADLPDPGIEPESIAFSALASGFFFSPQSYLGSPNTEEAASGMIGSSLPFSGLGRMLPWLLLCWRGCFRLVIKMRKTLFSLRF